MIRTDHIDVVTRKVAKKKKVSIKWMLCWGKIIDLLLFFMSVDPQWSHKDFHENPSMHPELQRVTVALHQHQNTSYSYTLLAVTGFTLHQGASWRGGFFRRRPETHLSHINAIIVVLFFMWRETIDHNHTGKLGLMVRDLCSDGETLNLLPLSQISSPGVDTGAFLHHSWTTENTQKSDLQLKSIIGWDVLRSLTAEPTSHIPGKLNICPTRVGRLSGGRWHR